MHTGRWWADLSGRPADSLVRGWGAVVEWGDSGGVASTPTGDRPDHKHGAGVSGWKRTRG
ncbi:hypothetical protein GCM10009730_48970 [Streptomyces albidochromogenes]